MIEADQFKEWLFHGTEWLNRGFAYAGYIRRRLREEPLLAIEPADLGRRLDEVLAQRQTVQPFSPSDLRRLSKEPIFAEADEEEAFAAWYHSSIQFQQRMEYLGSKLPRREKAAQAGKSEQPVARDSSLSIAEVKRNNKAKNDVEVTNGAIRLESYPQRLVVDPSSDCNIRCRICSHSNSQDFMHAEMGGHVFSALAEILPFVEVIYYYGTGEPLLSSELSRLILAGADSQVYADLLTNGTILNKKEIDFSRIGRIGVSLDGATRQTFEAIRVGASFDKVIENLRNLRTLAPDTEIYVNATVNRANMHEIAAIAGLARDLGVDTVQYSFLTTYNERLAPLGLIEEDEALVNGELGRAKEIFRQRGGKLVWSIPGKFPARPDGLKPMTREEVFDYLIAMPITFRPSGIQESAPEFTGSLAPFPEGMRDRLERAGAGWRGGVMRPNRFKVPHCIAPWRFSYIESTGVVRACCVLDEPMGDLASGDFRQVWNGQAYQRLREGLLTETDLPPACVSCQNGQRFDMVESLFDELRTSGASFFDILFPRDYFLTPYLLGDLFEKFEVIGDLTSIENEEERRENAEYAVSFLLSQPLSEERELYLGQIYLLHLFSEDLALESFEKVTAFNPDQPEAHYYTAKILKNKGRLQEAYSHAEKALYLLPNNMDFIDLRYDLMA